MWAIVSYSCEECGNSTVIKIQSNEPTVKEISVVEESLGGMYCIKSYVTEANEGMIIEMTRKQ